MPETVPTAGSSASLAALDPPTPVASTSSAPPSHALKKPRKPKPRIPLTGTPSEILSQNNAAAPQFWVDKTVRLAGKHWNDFYRNHGKTIAPRGDDAEAEGAPQGADRDADGAKVQFFKERHWTWREWRELEELGGGDTGKGKGKAVLETGCGTGAFIYPLLERYPDARFAAFDFAAKAVELTKSHPAYTPTRVHVFQHDLTAPPSRPSLASQLSAVPPEFGEPVQQFDIVSSIFVLSALAPRNHAKAVQTLISLLAPGGSLLFRDYALHDEAQLRFHALPSASYATAPSLLSPQTAAPPSSSSPSPLEEDTASLELNKPWYKRGDQTMTYFFTAAELEALVDAACTALGVRVEGGVGVVERRMENRGEGWACTRRFVHGAWKRVA
ncbi:hypothetical protein JCM1840_001825 [Sporobolomyces johnsonii]